MSDAAGDVDRSAGGLVRPAPPRTLGERVRGWLAWFGVARLAAGAVATVVVVGGAWWLVRAPVPSTEATLPMATGSSSTTTAGEVARSTAPSEPLAPARALVVVHVAGAVADPGVHELDSGARVVDAIAAAGGVVASAAPDSLNLAAVVVDAQRIYVPMVGETVPTSAPPADPVAGGASAGPVDLNRANLDELDTLPGIGPTTAASIVEHRERNGPFGSVDELLDVPGIGPSKLDAIRDLVTV